MNEWMGFWECRWEKSSSSSSSYVNAVGKDWTAQGLFVYKKLFPRLELGLIIEVNSQELSGWESDGFVVGIVSEWRLGAQTAPWNGRTAWGLFACTPALSFGRG